MFELFTARARKSRELAQEEALRLGHGYLGTEHILLGLMRKPKGAATRVLSNLGLDLDGVRREVVRALGAGRARRVLKTFVGGAMGRVVASRTIKKAFRARVEGLVIRARCGVTDEERAAPQPLRRGRGEGRSLRDRGLRDCRRMRGRAFGERGVPAVGDGGADGRRARAG